MDADSIRNRFEALYGRQATAVVRAPGRVNLIGEHTDYNGGFVLPIAIERQTLGAWSPRSDRTVNFTSAQGEGTVAVNLDAPITPGKPTWANYCKGVLSGLLARGESLAARGKSHPDCERSFCPDSTSRKLDKTTDLPAFSFLDSDQNASLSPTEHFHHGLLVGCDILFDSDVPIGGGLSSSASLEVATALALLAAAGRTGTVPAGELATICRNAEHDFAGAPCGIMDQSIVIMARAGRAMLLDCRDGTVRHVPFDKPDIVVLVADTRVKHNLAAGGYARRRSQCHSAAEKLGVETLGQLDSAEIDNITAGASLTTVELMRLRHVVSEIARTREAADALQSGDYRTFGELMYASHASLRDDFEVSCEQLDVIVESARSCDGVYGARMTGGGFGGCAVILAETDHAGRITEVVQSDFTERFGRTCPIFPTRAAAGAGVLEYVHRTP